jgi:hypothetical protein
MLCDTGNTQTASYTIPRNEKLSQVTLTAMASGNNGKSIRQGNIQSGF